MDAIAAVGFDDHGSDDFGHELVDGVFRVHSICPKQKLRRFLLFHPSVSLYRDWDDVWVCDV